MKTDPARSFKSKAKTHKNPNLEDRLKSAQDLIQFIQGAFAVVLGSSTFMLVSGFIIVNSYLARITDIHGYNVSTGQYFGAGIGFFISVTLGVIAVRAGIPFISRRIYKPERSPLFHGVLFLCLIALIAAMFVFFADGRLTPVEGVVIFVLVFMESVIAYSITNRSNRFDKLISVYFSFVIILAFVAIYSDYVYPNLPRSMGGGRPATIILVLKEGNFLPSFALSPGDINPNNTNSLMLLAELTDGLLVVDPRTGRAIAIRNELILAVIDDRVAEALIIPIRTPTAMFTPVPTVMATP